MLLPMKPGFPSPVIVPAQSSRAGWMVRHVLDESAAKPDTVLSTSLKTVEQDPAAARAAWLEGRPPSVTAAAAGSVIRTTATAEILTAVTGLRTDESGRQLIAAGVAASLGIEPSRINRQRVSCAVDVVMRGVLPDELGSGRSRGRHDPDDAIAGFVDDALRAALRADDDWLASGRVPEEVRTRVTVGILLAGPEIVESAAPAAAIGTVIETTDLIAASNSDDNSWRSTPFVTPADYDVPASTKREDVPAFRIGSLAAAWYQTSDASVFALDASGLELEAKVVAVRSAGGGTPLLRRLGADAVSGFRRTMAEPLPTELGDGVVLHRTVSTPSGALATRIDLIRTVSMHDVVVTSVVEDPAAVDAAAFELTILLAAVEPI